MIPELIAQATATAPQSISPELLGIIITAVVTSLLGGGAGGVWLHRKFRGTTTIEGQPIEIINATKPVSYETHQALDERVSKVETKVDSLSEAQHRQFIDILKAGEGRERRILETVKAGDLEIHRRLDAMLPMIPSRRKLPG